MKKILILIIVFAVAAVGAWMYFGRPAQVSAPQPAATTAPTPPQVSEPAPPQAALPSAIDTNDNLDDAIKDLDSVNQL